MGSFPGGRAFAFSILDDTDDATLENVRPVYDCLRDLGFRTTKTVWAEDCPEGSRLFFAADTLRRPDYLAYVRGLVEDGFELASHGATMESSPRERTRAAFAFLEQEFGHLPRLHANHAFNRENLYWGARRFRTPWIRGTLERLGRGGGFEGEVEGSPYFWGDLARQHIEYVRNFTFRGLDAFAFNPEMPYRLEDTPWVRFWFSTTDAPEAGDFVTRLRRPDLERLEEAGGVCIVSTHLGKGYTRDGRLRRDVETLLGYLAGRPGWYAPVSEILDHLVTRGAGGTLSPGRLRRLELRYLADQLVGRLGQR